MQKKPTTLFALDIISLILLGVSTYLALVFAPTEAVMGEVQRVLYFHVATAWVGMLGFVAAGVSGIVYLRTGNLKWDRVEMAAVEISLVFFFITIVLGFSGRVLAEVVLSYIGISVGADTVSWGGMITGALRELSRDPAIWWQIVATFVFMLGLILPANLFGDALRDALDPRLRTQ